MSFEININLDATGLEKGADKLASALDGSNIVGEEKAYQVDQANSAADRLIDAVEKTAPKKRGRPKKLQEVIEAVAEVEKSVEQLQAALETPQKKRGRPKKVDNLNSLLQASDAQEKSAQQASNKQLSAAEKESQRQKDIRRRIALINAEYEASNAASYSEGAYEPKISRAELDKRKAEEKANQERLDKLRAQTLADTRAKLEADRAKGIADTPFVDPVEQIVIGAKKAEANRRAAERAASEKKKKDQEAKAAEEAKNAEPPTVSPESTTSPKTTTSPETTISPAPAVPPQPTPSPTPLKQKSKTTDTKPLAISIPQEPASGMKLPSDIFYTPDTKVKNPDRDSKKEKNASDSPSTNAQEKVTNQDNTISSGQPPRKPPKSKSTPPSSPPPDDSEFLKLARAKAELRSAIAEFDLEQKAVGKGRSSDATKKAKERVDLAFSALSELKGKLGKLVNLDTEKILLDVEKKFLPTKPTDSKIQRTNVQVVFKELDNNLKALDLAEKEAGKGETTAATESAKTSVEKSLRKLEDLKNSVTDDLVLAIEGRVLEVEKRFAKPGVSTSESTKRSASGALLELDTAFSELNKEVRKVEKGASSPGIDSAQQRVLAAIAELEQLRQRVPENLAKSIEKQLNIAERKLTPAVVPTSKKQKNQVDFLKEELKAASSALKLEEKKLPSGEVNPAFVKAKARVLKAIVLIEDFKGMVSEDLALTLEKLANDARRGLKVKPPSAFTTQKAKISDARAVLEERLSKFSLAKKQSGGQESLNVAFARADVEEALSSFENLQSEVSAGLARGIRSVVNKTKEKLTGKVLSPAEVFSNEANSLLLKLTRDVAVFNKEKKIAGPDNSTPGTQNAVARINDTLAKLQEIKSLVNDDLQNVIDTKTAAVVNRFTPKKRTRAEETKAEFDIRKKELESALSSLSFEKKFTGEGRVSSEVEAAKNRVTTAIQNFENLKSSLPQDLALQLEKITNSAKKSLLEKKTTPIQEERAAVKDAKAELKTSLAELNLVKKQTGAGRTSPELEAAKNKVSSAIQNLESLKASVSRNLALEIDSTVKSAKKDLLEKKLTPAKVEKNRVTEAKAELKSGLDELSLAQKRVGEGRISPQTILATKKVDAAVGKLEKLREEVSESAAREIQGVLDRTQKRFVSKKLTPAEKDRADFQEINTSFSAANQDLRLQQTRKQLGLPNTFDAASERSAQLVSKAKQLAAEPERTDIFQNRIARVVASTSKTLLQFDESVRDSTRSIGQVAQSYYYLSTALNGAIQGLQNLAAFASSRDLARGKLDLANRLDTAQTEKDTKFLARTSRELGLSLSGSLQDLSRFKLSTPLSELDRLGNVKQSSLSTENLNTIFKGISDVSIANQLDANQRSGFNNVITQVLSKGVVQSQELKLQLPNFLPGSTNLFARSQGIDGQELAGRLERQELGVNTLVDFSRLLTREFGELAKVDNPARALNKFTAELENVGFKASQTPASILGAGVKLANPVLQGIQENTSTLTPILGASGVAAGLAFTSGFGLEFSKGLRSLGGQKILGALFTGLDLQGSIAKQTREAILSGVIGAASTTTLSSTGKGLGLVLGAGILSSLTIAVFGGEGLDTLFSRFFKNIELGAKKVGEVFGGVKLPGLAFYSNVANGLRDTLSQILPTALGIGGVGNLLSAGVDKVKSTGFGEKQAAKIAEATGGRVKVGELASNAVGLLSNPLVAVGAALVTYTVANSQFVTAFKEVADKAVVELGSIARRIGGGTDNKSAKGAVAAGTAEFLDNAKKGKNTGLFGIGTARDALTDTTEQLLNNVKGIGDQRLAILIEEQKAIKQRKSGGEAETVQKRIDSLLAEADRRANGGVREIKSGRRTSIDDRRIERQQSVDEINNATDALIERAKKPVEIKQNPVLDQQLAADRKRRTELLSSRFTNLDDERRKNDELTALNTRINKNKFQINEERLTPLKDRVADITNAIQSVEDKANQLIAKTLDEENPGFINSQEFQTQKESLERRKKALQKLLIEAKDALNVSDDAFAVSQLAIAAEGVARNRRLEANDNTRVSSFAQQQDALLRSTETNDRASSIRQSELEVADSDRTVILQKNKLADLEAQRQRLTLLAPGDDNDKATAELAEKISEAESALQNAITTQEKSILGLKKTAEDVRSRESELRVAQTTREFDRVGLENKAAVVKIFSNEENALASSNLGVVDAANAEKLAAFQVAEQEALVRRTVVNREAAEEKLEDLRTTLLQKGVERQVAERAFNEAKENRLVELTNRAVTEQSQGTEIFSARSSVVRSVDARLNERDDLVAASDQLRLLIRQQQDSQRAVATQQDLLTRTKFTSETQILRLAELRVTAEQKTAEVQSARLAKFKVDLETAFRAVDRVVEAGRQAKETADTRFSNAQAASLSRANLASPDRFNSDLGFRNRAQELQVSRQRLSRLESTSLENEFSGLNDKLAAGGIPRIPSGVLSQFRNLSPEQIATLNQRLVAAQNSFRSENRDASGQLLPSEPVSVDLGIGRSFDFGNSTGTDAALQAFIEFTGSLRNFKNEVTSLRQEITQGETELESLAIASKKASLANIQSLEDSQRANLNERKNRTSRQDRERGEVRRVFQDAGKTSSFVSTTSAIESKIDSFANNRDARLESNRRIQEEADQRISEKRRQQKINASAPGVDPRTVRELNDLLDKEIRLIQSEAESRKTPDNAEDITSISKDLASALATIANNEDRVNQESDRRFNRTNEALDLRNSLGVGTETEAQRSERNINNQVRSQRRSIQTEIDTLSKEAKPADLLNALNRLEGIATGADLVFVQDLKKSFLDLQKQGLVTSEAIKQTIDTLGQLKITEEERTAAILRQQQILANNTAITGLNNRAELSTSQAQGLRGGRRSGFNGLAIADRRFELDLSAIKDRAKAELVSLQNERLQAGPLTATEDQERFGVRAQRIIQTFNNSISDLETPLQAISGEISEIIGNGLNFAKFFKTLFDSSFREAIDEVGVALLDGLANYFSNRAQKALQNVFEGLFDGLFDGLLGSFSDSKKRAAQSGGLFETYTDLFGGSLGKGVAGLFGGSESSGSFTDTLLSFAQSALPSFANGTLDGVNLGTDYPRTFFQDGREGGRDSRLAVINSQEVVVPAFMAQDFLKYRDYLSEVNTGTSISNSTSNAYSTTNNNYVMNPDNFRRTDGSQVAINDRAQSYRDRFR